MKLTTFSPMRLLLLGLLFTLAACQPIVAPVQAPTAEPKAESATDAGEAATLSVEALKNATYSGIYDEPVTLTDGRYEGEPFVAGGASRPIVEFLDHSVRYGDLNSDGLDDAVSFLVESGGGSGNFVYVAAQRNQDGQPVDAGAVLIEDRIQIKSVEIVDGNIQVEAIVPGPGDAACCPSYKTSKRYALQDGRLAEVDAGAGELVKVSAADLDGANWRLVELAENEPVADEVEITITFAGDKISGSGGCNNYNGSFTLSDDNPFLVTFGPIASTRMACPDPAGNQENAYFSALAAASLWGYDFGNLVISYGSGEERDRLLFAPQPAAAAENANGPYAIIGEAGS